MRRVGVTAGTTTDPRDGEIERLRAELADAKAALAHALSRSAVESSASRYDDINAREAIDGIPGFVAILAADGNVEVVNRQIMTYSGRTREELRDWNAIGIVHDDDALRNAALFLEAIVHGAPYDHEIRLRRHDGVFRWFSNRGVPIKGDDGRMLRWYVLLTDIDDLKRAEERFAISQRELQRAIDATPALIWSGTPEGHTDSVNQYFVEYMGWTYNELKQSDWQIAIHPDDRAALEATWENLRATGQAGQTEARLRRHDGAYRWFLLRTHPLRDENGKVIRWYGVNTDIEDRKRAEQKLARSERNLQETVDAIPIQVICNTVTGLYISASRPWHDYSGLSPAAAEGTGWQQAFHPDDLPRLVEAWTGMLRSGIGGDVEGRLRRADGVYRWFLMRSSPLCDENGKVVRWYSTNTDIEHRKNIEQALAESEHSLRQTVDAIPALAWCNRPDGSNEFLNKRWHDYTGLSPAQANGWGWQAALHPDDLPGLMSIWMDMLTTGKPGELEARLRRHDGIYRWFLFRCDPLRDAAGNIVKWYGTNTDIEDLKRAEQALSENERRLQETIDSIPAVVFTDNADGSNEHISKGWHDYTGMLPEQTVGFGWTGAIHPEDQRKMMAERLKIRATTVGTEMEARVRRHDGVYRWFLFSVASLRDADGNVIKWFGTVTDIEDRKQAEAELQRAYRDLTEAQRLSRTGSFTNDYYGGTHLWSDELYRIFGFEDGSTVTQEATIDRVHPDDRNFVFATYRAAARTGKDIDTYFRILLPGGEVRHLHAIGHVTGWQEKRPIIVGAIQDITDTKRAEIALDRARSELAYAARVMSLGVLTASIAHEVNQPLAGIITNANTCQRMLSADPPNLEGARETLKRTIRDGYRASEVITRLRALFSNKDFAAESVDLNDATREVLAMTQDEMRRRRIAVRVEYEERLPPLTGDRVQLQQVVLNLLLNASDAMREVREHPREICIRTQYDSDTVCVSIRDTGSGIAPDVLKRLFEPFFTTKENGMGIGLSVSRSIIERHNGRLWAAPNDGPGVTFSFSIPLAARGAVATR